MKYIETSTNLLVFNSKGNIILIDKSNNFYPNLRLNLLSNATDEEIISYLTQVLAYRNYNTNMVKKALDKENVFIYNDSVVVNGNIIEKGKSSDFLVKLLETLIDTNKATTTFNHLKLFIDNILNNTFISDKTLFLKYLLNNDYEITEDGCILAYKQIRKNYTSFFDSKTLHSPNTTLELAEYDIDSNRACGKGLHFGTKEYVTSLYNDEGITVCVKINPIDIIAVPYQNSIKKCRCRKYTVIRELDKKENLIDIEVELAKEKPIKVNIDSENLKIFNTYQQETTEQTKERLLNRTIREN